jgi:LMBR1 domain-containing protein 1
LLTNLAVTLIIFITSLFRTPKMPGYVNELDAEEEEEEGLLASTGRRFGATWQDIVGKTNKRSGQTSNGN